MSLFYLTFLVSFVSVVLIISAFNFEPFCKLHAVNRKYPLEEKKTKINKQRRHANNLSSNATVLLIPLITIIRDETQEI